jgi:glycosyltransferase involved in cell wall biosynthesis
MKPNSSFILAGQGGPLVQLTALVESCEHVCCRYRLTAFRPCFEQAGYRLELRPLPERWWSRLRLFRSLRHTDVVILQRKLLQPWQLYFLRRFAPRLLFDFDDAVFLRDSYAAKGLHSTGRRRRFAATVRAADAVAAGNAFLQQQAGAVLPNADRVQLVPTCVDPGRYPLAPHEREGAAVQLVWTGSSSTLRGLESIRPLLEQIGQRCSGVRLRLICDRFLRLRHLPVDACPWTETSEAVELASADIGISWLPDDSWSRGKCGLKVLQYMAAGLPVVANPVGVQAEMVRHGETGFLVETPEQWTEAINRLARQPGLRRQMGQAGRRCVEANYSVSTGAARWLTLLQKLRRRDAA